MPIDKKKLAAVAGAVKPPKGKRFGLTAKPPEDEADLEEAEEDAEGEGDRASPQAVIPFLEQYAGEVQACCDELDPDVLVDPELELSDSDAVMIQEGAAMLPPRLRKLLPNLKGIEYEDAGIIAAALVERGKYEDAEVLAGWIFRIGQLLEDTEGAGLEETEEPDEEMEDEG
jgi:hypothetical protein